MQQQQVSYTGHGAAEVLALSVSPQGRQVASGGMDGTIQVWDAETGETVLTHQGVSNIVVAVAWSPDGQFIASTGNVGPTQIWFARTGNVLATVRDPGKGPSARSELATRGLSWSPGSRYLALIGDDGAVKIWDLHAGEFCRTIRVYASGGEAEASQAVAFDGQRVAFSDATNAVYVFDAFTGEELAVCTGHTSWVYALAWSPGGSRLVSGSNDGTARVWDIRGGGAQLAVLDEGVARTGEHVPGETVLAVDWSRDGRYIATAGLRGVVSLWDASSWSLGEPLPLLREQCQGTVRALAFFPDTSRIVAGGHDFGLRVWPLALTGERFA
jgi:WD40 repeat protein